MTSNILLKNIMKLWFKYFRQKQYGGMIKCLLPLVSFVKIAAAAVLNLTLINNSADQMCFINTQNIQNFVTTPTPGVITVIPAGQSIPFSFTTETLPFNQLGPLTGIDDFQIWDCSLNSNYMTQFEVAFDSYKVACPKAVPYSPVELEIASSQCNVIDSGSFFVFGLAYDQYVDDVQYSVQELKAETNGDGVAIGSANIYLTGVSAQHG